jgi:UDP-glucose:(heptosyl)LPS alpha-1,3-glucosyltransferase
MWPFSGTEHYSDNKKYIDGYKKIKTDYFTFDISCFIWKLKKKYYSNKISFIAPSFWIKKKIQKSYLCKNNSVYLIRNPINMSIWKYRKYKKKNNKIILAVCAFDLFSDNRKGFIKMINDLNKLQHKQDIEIYAIGNKTNLEIKSNIKIKSFGYIKSEKKISKIFNKCDALLMPSNADNFPNVGVEALASGLPVISLKNNGINEIISNKINGLTIKNFNKNNIIKIINWLIKIKKKNYNSKISNSMRDVISYESVSKKMINTYKKILDE